MRSLRRYLTSSILYIAFAAAGALAALPYTYVGGPVVPGASATGYNPVLIAGIDGAGNSQYQQAAQVITLLPSASRTVTVASADQTNWNCRAAYIILSVTVASGTGGLSIQIQLKDSISGNYKSINASVTPATATGTILYLVNPSTIAANGVTQGTQAPLPAMWRVLVGVGDASAYTYSVSAQLMP